MALLRVRLIHWNAAEAAEKASLIQAAGFEVDFTPFQPNAVRGMGQNLPAAVVIDLSRLPSQGRDVALQLRQYKPTRYIPLIFTAGDPGKTAQVKDLLPDATYTGWGEIAQALKQALVNPPADVVVYDSVFAGYSGTPLVKKLGIKANASVGLIAAPAHFVEKLGALPEGIQWHSPVDSPCDLLLWFARSKQELIDQIAQIKAWVGKDGVWIIWPKKTSGISCDLSEKVVRAIGLASGLVDYKICAVDATWSGLRFTKRKPTG
jgi:CheY-like chemotaxis protein